MAYNYEYPYTDPNRYNSDWILNRVKEVSLEWIETRKEWNNTREELASLKAFIQNYFAQLDLQDEVNVKLDIMARDGSLSALISPLFSEYKKEIDRSMSEQNDKINVLNSRMDTFTSLPDGSTAGDAELQDIRIGYNGKVYPSAGDAVRMQVSQLSGEIEDASGINDGAISGRKLDIVSYTKQLFNKKTINDNYFVNNTTGELIENNAYFCSTPIPISGGTKISFTPCKTRFSFEDKNKNFISGGFFTDGEFEDLSKITVESPINARYIIISCAKSTIDADSLMVNYGDGLLDYEEYTYKGVLKDNIDIPNLNEIKDCLSVYQKQSVDYLIGYVSSNGTIMNDSTAFRYFSIPCALNDEFRLTSNIRTVNVVPLLVLLKDGVVVDSVMETDVVQYTDYTFKCCYECDTIYINSYYETVENVMIQKKELYNVLGDVDNSNLKITVIGDSLVAQNEWQPTMCMELNCICKNLGVGGTPLAIGNEEHQTDYISSDARISEIPTDTDILFALFGTNDYHQSVPLGTWEDNDSSTFRGAMRYFASQIRTLIPTCKVFFMTPTVERRNLSNSLGLYKKDYVDAMLESEQYINVPVINLWGNIGVGYENIATYTKDEIHWNNLLGVRIGKYVGKTTKTYL